MIRSSHCSAGIFPRCNEQVCSSTATATHSISTAHPRDQPQWEVARPRSVKINAWDGSGLAVRPCGQAAKDRGHSDLSDVFGPKKPQWELVLPCGVQINARDGSGLAVQPSEHAGDRGPSDPTGHLRPEPEWVAVLPLGVDARDGSAAAVHEWTDAPTSPPGLRSQWEAVLTSGKEGGAAVREPACSTCARDPRHSRSTGLFRPEPRWEDVLPGGDRGSAAVRDPALRSASAGNPGRSVPSGETEPEWGGVLPCGDEVETRTIGGGAPVEPGMFPTFFQ
jgi:hypothetical protein